MASRKLNQQIAALECDPTMALSSRAALVMDSPDIVVDIISASHQGDAFRHMLRWNLVVYSSVVLRRMRGSKADCVLKVRTLKWKTTPCRQGWRHDVASAFFPTSSSAIS